MTTILKVMGIIIGGFFIISLGSCMMIGISAGIEHNNKVEKCSANLSRLLTAKGINSPAYVKKTCEEQVLKQSFGL